MAAPDIDVVLKIAALARLDIRGEEAARLSAQFARILEQFRVLETLDVTGVDPMIGGLDATRAMNVLRRDEPRPGLSAEDALRNAPARMEDFYRVPKTVGTVGTGGGEE